MPRNLIRARKANSSVLKVRSRRRVLSLLGEVLSKHHVLLRMRLLRHGPLHLLVKVHKAVGFQMVCRRILFVR